MQVYSSPTSPTQSQTRAQTQAHTQAETTSSTGHWPRPPACLRACDLTLPPVNARVAVAGLVILRQRPGTAKGVIFVTLEDETGVVNIIVWRHIYERFRRAVVAGRMLRVTGRVQRAHGVIHVLAEEIEDISPMLDHLLAEDTGRKMAAEVRVETTDGRRVG